MKNTNKTRKATGVIFLCLLAILLTTAVALGLVASRKTIGPVSSDQIHTEDVLVPSVRGSQIHTTITVPQIKQAMPLVVMCHGFTGNRKGDGHFAPMAQTLAQAGIATVCLDFAGNGESEEPFAAYTLSGMSDDIDSVIAYMESEYSIRKNRIGLLGHSMGGRVVSLHLSKEIAAAALWSPADNDGLDGLEFFSQDAAERAAMKETADANGTLEVTRWGVTVSNTFMDEMAESHPWATIESYRGKLLVAFAGGDPELLSQQTIDGTVAAATARSGETLNLYGQYPDANHNYGALSYDEAASALIAADIEQKTTDFLIAALTA